MVAPLATTLIALKSGCNGERWETQELQDLATTGGGGGEERRVYGDSPFFKLG